MNGPEKSEFPKALLVWFVTICSLLLLMEIDYFVEYWGIIVPSLLVTFMACTTIWYLNEYPNFSIRSDSIKYGAIIGFLFFTGVMFASNLILDSECVENRSGPPVCPRLISDSLWDLLEITAAIVMVFGGMGLIGFYFSENKRISEQKEYAETARRNRQDQEYRGRKIKEATAYFQKGGLTNLQNASAIYTNLSLSTPREIREEIASEKEKLLDFEGALSIFEELEMHQDAKRIRQKMGEKGKVKVDQTVVHGDYVDDRDTIVKDSVINRSNLGGGSDDKIAKLEKIAEMKDKGIIDDDEFKQMKKEILGK